MGCYECMRIGTLFAEAISKHAALRQEDLAAHRAGDVITAERIHRELENSSVEIRSVRTQLLNHEASHNRQIPKPRDERQSSEA